MLQVCEYNIGDYLEWYHRTSDFAHVERRKHLIRTTKAILILSLGWVIQLSLYSLAILIAFSTRLPYRYALALVGVIIVPFITAYILLAPLILVRIFVQRPIEWFITSRAQRQLAAHPAIKIAVAGSFGKTSMREILRTVITEGKRVAAPPHSYNTPLGISRFVQSLKKDEEVLVFELGEYYPGDVRRLCRLVQPTIGVITGVNEAHLHKFKNLDRTVATIFELADWVNDGPVYVNGESELAKSHARAGQLVYSRSGVGDWQVKYIATGLDGTSFTLAVDGHEFRVSTKLLGAHQIGPMVAAAAIAHHLGLSFEQITRGLQAITPFEHRLQPTSDAAGVIMLDDSYNGNPSGVKAVIDFLGSITDHRRIYVTPGLVEMGGRTQEVHRQIGLQLAASGIEQVILIHNSATPHIAEGLKEAGYKGQVAWYNSGPEAFAALPHLTVRGDVVLLQNDWPDQYS